MNVALQVAGLPTNIEFLQSAASHPAFVEGGVDTSFLDKHLKEVLPPKQPVPALATALSAIAQAAVVQATSVDSALETNGKLT